MPIWFRLKYRMVGGKETSLERLDAAVFLGPEGEILEGKLSSRISEQFKTAVSGAWQLRWVGLVAHFRAPDRAEAPRKLAGTGPLDRFFGSAARRRTIST